MKIIQNLTNGNQVTQRNAFIVIAVVIILTVAILNHFGVISLVALNN